MRVLPHNSIFILAAAAADALARVLCHAVMWVLPHNSIVILAPATAVALARGLSHAVLRVLPHNPIRVKAQVYNLVDWLKFLNPPPPMLRLIGFLLLGTPLNKSVWKVSVPASTSS